MWKTYYTPSSLDEAVRLLADHAPEARIVAGATDLILELERGIRQGINTLIDITRIPGLKEITLDDRGWIRLGPVVTHNQCAASTLLFERAFALAKACSGVGSPQIRTRATVAGNLITASPANDTIPPLTALGAQVTLRSAAGERVVALEDFYQGVRRTVMRPDELLVEIAFPALPAGARSTFNKLALRRAVAISVVNSAVVLHMERGKVSRASVTLGAVAPTIVHASQAEQFLAGRKLTSDVVAEAGELAVKSARPIDDIRASAAYRAQMVNVCTARSLRALSAGQEQQDFPRQPILLEGGDRAARVSPPAKLLVHQEGTPIETTINGRRYAISEGQHKTLLRLLREEVGLIGTKEGCAEGECGACTVFLDGAAVMACLVPAPRAHGAQVTTVEGLAEDGKLHPVQQAFIDEGAVQCGYCTPGFLMSGAKLLEERPHPDGAEIRHAISGNLCRCTGYYKIISAIEKAATLAARRA